MTHTTRRFVTAAAVAVLAVALLTGCSKPAEDAAKPGDKKLDTVKIGFAAPLTGDNAIYGQGMKRAVELAMEEVNASPEAAAGGFKFELRAEDDMGDPKQAVNVANLLASDKGVVGVVGHFNSGCSIPASPVYNTSSIAMVSVSSNPALTAQGLPNVNRVVAKDDAQGAAAGELVAGTLGLKSVAIVDDSTPYGQGLAAQFTKAYEAKGGKIIAAEQVQSADVDFNALVSRIKAKKPQAIYWAGALNQGGLLSKQSKEAGLEVPLIGGDMIFSADFIKIAGEANAEGDIATSLGLPLEQQPKGKEFAAAYKAKFNEDPQAYDSYAYDCAKIIMNAVIEAGNDRAAVMAAVRAGTIDGVTGVVSFDENGDNKQQIISQYKVTEAAWKQLQ